MTCAVDGRIARIPRNRPERGDGLTLRERDALFGDPGPSMYKG